MRLNNTVFAPRNSRCRSLRTPPNYLILNLAISDFFMMAKSPIYIINSLYYGPVLGQLGCSIYGFVGALTGTASIMTLASIALDRYYAIVHPLNPFKRTTSRRATLMILFVWMYAALFSSLPFFGVNNYTSEGYLTSCSFDYLSENMQHRIFVFVFFLAAWFCPFVVILFSYANIFRIVREAERTELFFSNGRRHASGESFKCKPELGRTRQRSEVKIALLAGILISLWLIAWTPYALIALMGIFGGKEYLRPLISAIPALFCKTASCINPFVYSLNHPKFQREFRSRFTICFRFYRKRRKVSRDMSFYSTVTDRENENSIAQVDHPSLTTRQSLRLTNATAVDAETTLMESDCRQSINGGVPISLNNGRCFQEAQSLMSDKATKSISHPLERFQRCSRDYGIEYADETVNKSFFELPFDKMNCNTLNEKYFPPNAPTQEVTTTTTVSTSFCRTSTSNGERNTKLPNHIQKGPTNDSDECQPSNEGTLPFANASGKEVEIS